MSQELDLTDLHKVAEAATPGPWTLEYENADDWESGINDGDYPNTIHGPRNCSFDHWADKSKVQEYLNRITEISELTDTDATHIATFDPTTVLALIEALTQAKQAESRVRKQHEPMPYRRGARNTGVPEFVCKACHAPTWGAVEYPCPTIRALDGEPNE